MDKVISNIFDFSIIFYMLLFMYKVSHKKTLFSVFLALTDVSWGGGFKPRILG